MVIRVNASPTAEDVRAAARRRGVASALLASLAGICRARGCGEMFVLTDVSNKAAMAAYRKSGAVREADSAMLHWQF